MTVNSKDEQDQSNRFHLNNNSFSISKRIISVNMFEVNLNLF